MHPFSWTQWPSLSDKVVPDVIIDERSWRANQSSYWPVSFYWGVTARRQVPREASRKRRLRHLPLQWPRCYPWTPLASQSLEQTDVCVLEQQTFLCLGTGASSSLRYSRLFCFCIICSKASTPLCDVDWEYVFVIQSLYFSNPCWVNGSIDPWEFFDMMHHCMHVRCYLVGMINFNEALNPTLSESFKLSSFGTLNICWALG